MSGKEVVGHMNMNVSDTPRYEPGDRFFVTLVIRSMDDENCRNEVYIEVHVVGDPVE